MMQNTINYFLGILGFKIAKKLNQSILKKSFLERFESCKNLSSKKVEFFLTLENILDYLVSNKIDGEIVECGVFKGANCRFICDYLKTNGFEDKKIYLYDTFEGMPTASSEDININSKKNYNEYLDNNSKSSSLKNFYRYENINNVEKNLLSTKYDKNKIFFIKGLVEETIPKKIPEKICLLILDTDYYKSTKHELNHLYPLLIRGGVLIIDDYGTWAGVKKAVDEYFIDNKNLRYFIDHKTLVFIKN